jgi:hypothetical protein
VFLSQEPGIYDPYLIATVSLHYVQPSHGLDAWEERVILAPLRESDPLESAALLPPHDLELSDAEPEGAEFVAPPSGSVSKASLRSYGKQIKSYLYQGCPKSIWQCKALELRSKPQETKAEFSARAQLAHRERRDAAVQDLRERLAKTLRQMDDRIRRAEARIQREQSQYDQQKLQTGISMGATLLGAILGRGGLGGATTAARGAGRVARERQDVDQAEQELSELQEGRRALERDAEEEIRALRASLELEVPEIEEVVVRPRKSDIHVSGLRIGWKRD